ncbi:MAG: prephenate dehydrogenase [Terriglobales bacterium]
MHFRQITIAGVGLIGGSFGLAARRAGFMGRILGCDRADVLLRARGLGAIDDGFESLLSAAAGSDLIVLAAPVGAIIDMIGQIPSFPPDALVTDAGSTKQAIVERARAVLGEAAGMRFLPGHPLAGKEAGGIGHADAELFRGATWLITPIIGAPGSPHSLCSANPGYAFTEAQQAFFELVGRMGTTVAEIEPRRHDRLCAWSSHLPQMVATALATVLDDELSGEDAILFGAGRAAREMTRLASSPYSIWRDIALTNQGNLEGALLKLELSLSHLRENLSTRGLEEQFEQARRFRKRIEAFAADPAKALRD